MVMGGEGGLRGPDMLPHVGTLVADAAGCPTPHARGEWLVMNATMPHKTLTALQHFFFIVTIIRYI